MPLIRRPEAGDTVVLRGVVRRNDGGLMAVKPEIGPNRTFLAWEDSVSEIIPKPYEPKVGDTVWHCARENLYTAWSLASGLTLIAIHEDRDSSRKWAVVAYRGDMPKGIFFADLRKDRASCVD